MKNYFKFFEAVGKMKQEKRIGWLMKKIRNSESVAEHCYRTAVMALIFCPKNFNEKKVVEMALIHDLAEAECGDIPGPAMKKKKKHAIERKALEKIIKPLKACKGKKILGLWNETEACKTKEAKFVKDLDYIETMLQALEYEKTKKKTAREFIEWYRPKLKTKIGKKIADSLLKNYEFR